MFIKVKVVARNGTILHNSEITRLNVRDIKRYYHDNGDVVIKHDDFTYRVTESIEEIDAAVGLLNSPSAKVLYGND